VRQQEAARELKLQISASEKRIAELDVLLKKLYEAYAMGKLPEARYDLLSAEYEQEQAELKAALDVNSASLEQFNADTERVDQFLALVKKYTDFPELTPTMVNEFIEKIVVHGPGRDEYGDRCMEVEIYLNFIGKFDVPPEEPTPEELAEEETRHRKRAETAGNTQSRKRGNKKIRDGLIVPGEPYTHICQGCGRTFNLSVLAPCSAIRTAAPDTIVGGRKKPQRVPPTMWKKPQRKKPHNHFTGQEIITVSGPDSCFKP
jgi:hypothetical protein